MPIRVAAPTIAVILLTFQAARAGQASDEATAIAAIRSIRAQSNAAIAAHDADAAVAPMHADARILGSGGGLIEGAAAMRKAFATSFAGPGFVTYLRSPSNVEISHGNDVAAETGEWRASWRDAGGARVVSGKYLATWRKLDGNWKITAEQFIPLACSGGSSCPRR